MSKQPPSSAATKVSIGHGVHFTKPNEMRLADIYNHIRNPASGGVVKAIQQLRDYVDQHQDRINELEWDKEDIPGGATLGNGKDEELKELKATIRNMKAQLRAFCWSGTFESKDGPPKNDGLKQHSGRLQIDIDWKAKPRIASEELRNKLAKDPHIEVSFLSPTGRGVKCALLVPLCANDKEHKQVFTAAQQYFKEVHSLEIDSSCSDVRRLCFFSYDPELITNERATPLDVEHWGHTKSTQTTFSTEEKITGASNSDTDERSLWKAQPLNNAKTLSPLTFDDCSELLGFIKEQDQRSRWIEIGIALKQVLGEAGYSLWERWSAESTKWQDVDEAKNRKRWEGFNPTGKGAGKLIELAKEGGWVWKEKRTKDTDKHDTSTGRESTDTGQDATDTTPEEAGAGKIKQGNFHMMRNKEGKEVFVPNLHNLCEVLKIEKTPIWYDTFLQKKQTNWQANEGNVTDWSDALTLELTRQFQSFEGLRRISRDLIDQAVELHAHERKRNCLTDWLDSLQWDGKPRLNSWLIDYCGAQDNAYTREAGRCWLLAAMARAYAPGTKFDHCLVLEGKQGIGKSTALKILANNWFTELNKFEGKDSAELLQATWIVEISELDGMKKAEVESVKRFLTTLSDKYRPPWGRHVVENPRTCVFAGTTNEDSYLRDPTGNRRFWPVKCHWIKREDLQEDCEKLLAEAVQRYRQGESFLMHKEAAQQAVKEQEGRYTGDAWEESIASYIEKKEAVTIAELLESALDFGQKGLWKKTDEIRVGNILKTLGWQQERVQVNGKRRRQYIPPPK